jgi:glutamine---fructose-6-phosphate transaminase (isomerizing)
MSLVDGQNIAAEIENIPGKIDRILKLNQQIEYIASEFQDSRNFLYLGRGYNFPVALEGALKLKKYHIFMQKGTLLLK